MPSPFPGMDPYLENPEIWPGVQSHFIVRLSTELNKLVPRHYVADIGVRELVPEEVREPFINILDVTDKHRIVTAIEGISPNNKQAGSEWRKHYLKKQREVLERRTPLIEIDLLRHGEHTVRVPLGVLSRSGEWDYLICSSGNPHWDKVQVWPVLLDQRLPRIQIPLSGKDPDVVLDLQKVMDQVYDEGAYQRKIDYRRDPAEPLTPEQDEWAHKLLRKAGLRR